MKERKFWAKQVGDLTFPLRVLMPGSGGSGPRSKDQSGDLKRSAEECSRFLAGLQSGADRATFYDQVSISITPQRRNERNQTSPWAWPVQHVWCFDAMTRAKRLRKCCCSLMGVRKAVEAFSLGRWVGRADKWMPNRHHRPSLFHSSFSECFLAWYGNNYTPSPPNQLLEVSINHIVAHNVKIFFAFLKNTSLPLCCLLLIHKARAAASLGAFLRKDRSSHVLHCRAPSTSKKGFFGGGSVGWLT